MIIQNPHRSFRPKQESSFGHPTNIDDNPYNNNIRNLKTNNPSFVPASISLNNIFPQMQEMSKNKLASRGNNLVYGKKNIKIRFK